MSTAIQVQRLRTRAQELRAMSNTIAYSPALTVRFLAGPATWVGPTAVACCDALVALCRQLRTQQDSLNDSARILDRRADELEQRPPLLVTVS